MIAQVADDQSRPRYLLVDVLDGLLGRFEHGGECARDLHDVDRHAVGVAEQFGELLAVLGGEHVVRVIEDLVGRADRARHIRFQFADDTANVIDGRPDGADELLDVANQGPDVHVVGRLKSRAGRDHRGREGPWARARAGSGSAGWSFSNRE